MNRNLNEEAPEHGITIWLDTYDDIFSDFDPRDYEHRALSDDFLGELRKISREDEGEDGLREFHLLIPSRLRDNSTEAMITHRLHTYFRKGLQTLNDDIQRVRTKSLLLIMTGILFLLAAGYISFTHPMNIAWHLLKVTLEPAGWFFAWMGYDNLVNGLVRKKADVKFHTRMTKNKILFKGLADNQPLA